MYQEDIQILCEAMLHDYEDKRATFTPRELQHDALELYEVLKKYPVMEDVCDKLLGFTMREDICPQILEVIIVEALLIIQVSLN